MAEKFNGILDELKEKTAWLGEKAAAAAKTVGNKTSETVELAAVNVKIKKVEGDIKNLYRQIGEITYKNAGLDLAEQEDITPLIGQVDAKHLEIESLKQESQEIKEKYSDDAEEDIEVEIITEEEQMQEQELAVKTCPGCGKIVQEQDIFCQHCGMKM